MLYEARSKAIISVFRVVAIAESVSLIVLLVGMAMRLAAGAQSIAGVVGPVHGMLFISYVALVLMLRGEQRWGPLATTMLIAASVVPFGGWLAERHVTQHSREGEQPSDV